MLCLCYALRRRLAVTIIIAQLVLAKLLLGMVNSFKSESLQESFHLYIIDTQIVLFLSRF